MPLCAANTPACGIFCGALCGLRLPSDGLSRHSWSCQCVPTLEAAHGGDPGSPEPSCGGGFCGAHFGLRSLMDRPSYSGDSGASSLCLDVPIDRTSCGGDSGGIPSLHHASLFAQGSNASGCVVVAFTAPPASLMLVVPLVGASVPFSPNNAPPGSCASTTMHSMTPMPTFPAIWIGPRPTPPGSSGGSLHRLGGLKDSRQGSATCCTGATPSPGTMPRTQVLSDGRKMKN